jgi:hypothetical protein
VSDEHVVKETKFTGLKEMVAVGLDEAFTAFEEALRGLTDEQVRAFPIPERNNIAWIAMHALGNLDHYACYAQSRERAVGRFDPRWDWRAPRPRPNEDFPRQAEIMAMLRAVREKATAVLGPATVADLEEPMADHPAKQPRTDAYARTIFHTMAHVRQIWLLRGALGLTDGAAWPMQHWC